VHGGKLPEYRGPQPVFWEILNRETEGAVTVHRMDEQFDHGPIAASCSVPIGPEDTHGLHLVRLTFAAVKVVEALFGSLVQYGSDLPTLPQDENRAAFHRRPSFEDLVIRWDEQPAARIRAIVKAGNPWNNGAFASIRGINLRITDVTLREDGGEASASPGTILTADATEGVVVNCRDGSALKLDVVSMDEGIFPGGVLATFGIQAGERFVAPMRQDALPTVATG
jgi:methionyl-tRNA formyltransferase